MKLQDAKDKEKILNVVREKRQTNFIEERVRKTCEFLSETTE